MMQDIGGQDLRNVFLDSANDFFILFSREYYIEVVCRVEKHDV